MGGGILRLLNFSFGDADSRRKPWEHEGRLYTWLGVGLAKQLFSSPIWQPFNPGFRFSTHGKRMLADLDHALRQAETGHALAFGVMLGFILYALAHSGWDPAG